jgi:hypothetical protein
MIFSLFTFHFFFSSTFLPLTLLLTPPLLLYNKKGRNNWLFGGLFLILIL